MSSMSSACVLFGIPNYVMCWIYTLTVVVLQVSKHSYKFRF